jgi:Na+/H+-dicarboxylate symporter
MYAPLLQLHSGIRYLVLILLITVVAMALASISSKKSYKRLDDKLSLWLVITTHTQLLLGMVLYFISPFVQFSGSTMKDSTLRYWTAEHVVGMLIAIVLITVARSTAKRMTDDTAKFKRLAIFNGLALLIIVLTIFQSGRPIFF